MYQFKIVDQLDGGYKFELGDIKMFVEDYIVKNNTHNFINPAKAIAYFNFQDNIYGVSNEPLNFATAEAFFDAITQQYKMLAGADPVNDKQKLTA